MPANTTIIWNNWTTNTSAASFNTITTAAADTAEVWRTWNADYTVTAASMNQFVGNSFQAPEISEEERQRSREAAEERNRLQREASQRADLLLLEHLTEEQRLDFEQHNWFDVIAKSRKRYRFHRGTNPRLMENNREVASYCIHPSYDFPEGDRLLALKVKLEAEEEEFLSIANETRYYVGSQI